MMFGRIKRKGDADWIKRTTIPPWAPGRYAPFIHLLIGNCVKVYIVSLFTSPFILFSSLFPFLMYSFSLRIDLLRLQAGGRKRRPNLGF